MLQSRGSRVLVYYGGSLVAAVAAGFLLRRFGPGIGSIGIVTVMGALIVAAHVAFLWYWRGLDETARAAHKDALFWGGLCSSYAISLLAATVRLEPDLFPITDQPQGVVFALGILTSLVLWIVGCLAAWGIWWLRRR